MRDLKRQLREASRAGPAQAADATVEELQRALREVSEGWPQGSSGSASGQATPQEGEAGPPDANAAWSKAQLMRRRYLEARAALEALQSQTSSLISVSKQGSTETHSCFATENPCPSHSSPSMVMCVCNEKDCLHPDELFRESDASETLQG